LREVTYFPLRRGIKGEDHLILELLKVEGIEGGDIFPP
jgi:hypothetical protein